MSPVAHIPSHRKPRRAASPSTRALRAGVTGGILSLAVAGTTVQASASEQTAAESTLEMPTVSAALATTTAQSADATLEAATGYEIQAQQDQAADHARAEAKKAKEKAEAKAKAKREAARKEAQRKAEERAAQARSSRSTDRTPLGDSTPSTGSGSGTSTQAPSTSSSGNVATLLNFLRAQVGKAYVPGATGPSSYDCSGLTQTAFRQINISLPRISQQQSTVGTQVSLNNLQPGDLLYWGSPGSAYHVAVYVGGGNFIGAQNSSTGVVERPLSYDPPTGAVRVL
ncbi:C40 family peptidase [Streptomyces palmae]|uniref:NlpC/P60 family protein n=1 Tax=Streptomyces palmae TaxID=1701085 RepID=A0A4Z0G354_9ACTN|nr:C40 family peptidase [Streptomyces palmae]TGA88595.1 NlpC/P60 family protein [Streptomyces palmae]